MRGELGFFDVDERLKELSAKGDDLERLNAIVDFEMFRADLQRAVPRSDRSRGGPATLRSGADVQGPDPPVEPFAIGRADGISDQGPSFVHALPGVVAGSKRAGRELDLELS